VLIINHQRHFSATKAILKAEYNLALCIMIVCSLKMAFIPDTRCWWLTTEKVMCRIYLYSFCLCANPFNGARVLLTGGHFDHLTGAFLFTTSRLLRQLFALPKFLATTTPLHAILQLKATTSVREVSKRLSW